MFQASSPSVDICSGCLVHLCQMLSGRASPHTPEDIHGFRGYLEDEYEHCRISLPREQPAWPADQANLYSAKKKNNAFAKEPLGLPQVFPNSAI